MLFIYFVVVDVVVIGILDEEIGEVLKVFVVKRIEIDVEELMVYVVVCVVLYARIRCVEFIDVIPKLVVGKILRCAFRDCAQ